MVKWTLRVSLRVSSISEAGYLHKVLLPDLVETPRDLVFSQRVELNILEVTVCDVNYRRLRSTIDEVLAHCDLLIRLERATQ
jgi:hypothetical protein